MMLHCSLLVDSDGLAGDWLPDAAPAAVPEVIGVDAGWDADVPPFGDPVVVASGLAQPAGLAADEGSIYWLQGDYTSNSTLSRRPATVEGVTSALAQSLIAPRALAVNATSVFFAAGGAGGWTYVSEVPTTGGNSKQTFANGAGTERIPAIAIEGRSIALVWNESGGNVHVIRASSDGSGAIDVAVKQSGASAVVLRAPYVYWNSPSGILRSSGQSPAAPEVFSTQSAETVELAADDTALYWAAADGKIRSLRFDQPGRAPVVLASDLKSPRGVAVDATHVYWASSTTGEVAAVPKAGGAPIVIATGQEPYAIAATATAVFFTDRSAGTLVRVPKN